MVKRSIAFQKRLTAEAPRHPGSQARPDPSVPQAALTVSRGGAPRRRRRRSGPHRRAQVSAGRSRNARVSASRIRCRPTERFRVKKSAWFRWLAWEKARKPSCRSAGRGNGARPCRPRSGRAGPAVALQGGAMRLRPGAEGPRHRGRAGGGRGFSSCAVPPRRSHHKAPPRGGFDLNRMREASSVWARTSAEREARTRTDLATAEVAGYHVPVGHRPGSGRANRDADVVGSQWPAGRRDRRHRAGVDPEQQRGPDHAQPAAGGDGRPRAFGSGDPGLDAFRAAMLNQETGCAAT